MRWIIRGILAAIVLGLVGMGALLAVPSERIADLAAERITSATGREVRIGGSVRPTLWPSLGVRAEEVEIGNPPWVGEGPLIRARRLNVGVNWGALFSGRVRLERAQLDQPHIVLIRDAEGRASWDMSRGPVAAGTQEDADAPPRGSNGGGVLGRLGFDRAEINGGRVLFADRAAGTEYVVEDLDARLSMPDPDGGAEASVSGTLGGMRIRGGISVARIGSFLTGTVEEVDLTLAWTGGEAAFRGRAALSPAAEGRLEIEATDLGPLLALAGQTPPDLPEGLGRDRISAVGNVTLASEGSLHLRDGDIRLDGTRLLVSLDITQGPDRPGIRGTVRGGAVDLSALGEGRAGQAGGDAAPAGGGWSRAPIDVGGLFAADAELAVALDTLDLGVATLDPVSLRADLDRGRLVLDIGQIGAFGGDVAGQFVVNGRGGLSARADLDFTGVRLAPLLEATTGYDRLEGSGDVSINLLGVGNDMATLLASLDGEGRFSFGPGAILGFDLAGMIRNFDASYRGEGQRTVFDAVTAGFTVAGGVARNEDLRLDAPWGEVTGAGEADIGAQTVDYRVIPGVIRGEDGAAAISVPILITGPWSDLRFRPDLEYLAEQELAAERDRLEAAARERLEAQQERLETELREQVGEALDVEIDTDTTVEEVEQTLEDRLREEAEQRLRELLE